MVYLKAMLAPGATWASTWYLQRGITVIVCASKLQALRMASTVPFGYCSVYKVGKLGNVTHCTVPNMAWVPFVSGWVLPIAIGAR